MASSERDYIISNNTVCNLENDDFTDTMLSSILKNNYVSGAAMKAAFCIFNHIFKSVKTKNAQKWLSDVTEMASGVESYVYVSNVAHIILKISKTIDSKHLLREYFIGVKAINNLRYTIPGFVYTLGGFYCPANNILCKGGKDTIILGYEKLEGITVSDRIKTGTFDDFLDIFVQLLLYLEVAQREICFTHFDLHPGNIIVNDKPNDCNLVLDSKYFTLNTKLYVTIIDYGFACAVVNGKSVGRSGYSKFGIMEYMIPGYDMYKFLVFCMSYMPKSVVNQVKQLFDFYGEANPYNIHSSHDIHKALHEYCKKVTYSQAAITTPLDFLNWMLTTDKFRKKIIRFLTIKERDVFKPLQNQILTRILYSKILGKTEIDKCLDLVPSYVMLSYNYRLLKTYSRSKKLETILTNNKKILMDIDMKMLSKYKKIQLPDIDVLNNAITEIVSTCVTDGDTKKKHAIGMLKNTTGFYHSMKPYYTFLYTIKELNFESIYSKFIRKFTESKQHKMYQEYTHILNSATRWATSLDLSIVI